MLIRSFILFICITFFPFQLHSGSDSKKNLESEFKKIKAETIDTIPHSEFANSNVYSIEMMLASYTEENLQVLKDKIDYLNQRIELRKRFLKFVSEITDESFKTKNNAIIHKAKSDNGQEYSLYRRFFERAAEIDVPLQLEISKQIAKCAISLQNDAILNYDIHPETVALDLKAVSDLFEKAKTTLEEALNTYKKYASAENREKVNADILKYSACKTKIDAIREEIEKVPALLQERLVELIDQHHDIASRSEAIRSRVSGIFKALENSQAVSPEEVNSIQDKLSVWEASLLSSSSNDPLNVRDARQEELDSQLQFLSLMSQPEVDDKKLYASSNIISLDTQFASKDYTLFADQFYRFFITGKEKSTVLKISVYDHDEVIHEERLCLPKKETLDWDFLVAEDGLLWTPETQLYAQFGLDLRIRFLPGPLYVPKLILSLKGMESNYRYTVSFENESSLCSFSLTAPPPWQLDVIRKPVQSTATLPFVKSKLLLPPSLVEIPHEQIKCASNLLIDFVKEMGGNPMALTQYVQNEIELVDPFNYVEGNYLLPPPIYRSLVDTFLNREGSAWEQCALLTFLLQQAGYQAMCVEGDPHSIPGEFVERMLSLYFPDVKPGEPVQLKYPWVLLKIDSEWISLFPWIKDIQVSEGYDAYGFLPDEYASGDLWIKRYLSNDPEISKHIGPDGNDTAGVLFVRFLEEHLAKQGLALQDVGSQRRMCKKQYSSWDEFPRPNRISESLTVVNFADRNDLFTTFDVSIYSANNPEKQINTKIMRFADLQGRSIGISFSAAETDKHTLHLTLPGDGEKQLTLDSTDHHLILKVKHDKHKSEINPYFLYEEKNVETFHIVKGTCAALCFQTGHCSSKNVSLLGKQIADQTSERERLHAILSFVGAAYFEKCSRAEKMLTSFHKLPSKMHVCIGLAKLSPDTSNGPIIGDPVLVFPQVDMHWIRGIQMIENRFQEVSSGLSQLLTFLSADFSANEHQVLNDIFDDSYAISTIKLLQIAHKNHLEKGGEGTGFLVFTAKSFNDADLHPEVARSTYFSHIPDISLRKIKEQGQSQWEQVRKSFTLTDAQKYGGVNFILDSYAYMTPGPIANLDNENEIPSYIGIGTFIVHPLGGSALIADGTNHLHGGFGSRLSPTLLDQLSSGQWSPPISLQTDYSRFTNPYTSPKPDFDSEVLPSFSLQPQTDNTKWDYDEFAARIRSSTYEFEADVRPDHKSILSSVADPVDVVTGAFYVDEVDLTLSGIFPLLVRRNYNSQNPYPGHLGFGWKLGFSPQLHEEDDKLMAAEEDGTVIVYRLNPDTSRWEVFSEDNPDLQNFNSKGIGGTANPYHAYIEKGDGYILYGTDGSKRTFKNLLLQKWEDHRGNSVHFSYKDDLLTRIENNVDGFMGFYYDHENRISEAYTADGRRIIYDYDAKGNLAEVTLPNGGVISYRYDDAHQLIRETKPHGRVLENIYLNGKVIEQRSPVGPKQSMATSATFAYEQDKTKVTDGAGYTTEYCIYQKQIYKVIDPEGNKIHHSWFIDYTSWFDAEEGCLKTWEGTGSWPKSLKSSVDKRGLVTEYRYDTKGNPTEIKLVGVDLTGNGVSEISKQLRYNERNLLVEETAINKSSRIVYDPAYPYLVKRHENHVDQQLVSAVNYDYYPSGLIKTEETEGSSTYWEYTPQGFPSKVIQKTFTDDPDVVTEFEYNARGQCIKATTADSISTFQYDIMGNREKETVCNLSNKLISEVFLDYNLNNEVIWEKGLFKHQTTFYDYHANGQVKAIRKTLSDVNIDSNGNVDPIKIGTACTLYDYDVRGCKRLEIDPRGYQTVLEYDPLCRLASITKNDLTYHYTYEDGGQLATSQGPNGALTQHFYTTNGLLNLEQFSDGTESSSVYDVFGRLIIETVQGIVWDISYDDIARKVTRTHRATGVAETREFDVRGNEIAFTDAEGFTWIKVYDGLNRLVSETDPEGWTTTWNYCGDRIICLMPNGERYEKRYEAGSVVESKTFDDEGTVIAQSSRTFYPYHNRLDEKSGNLVTSTIVNTMGQPLLVYDGIGKIVHHYDPCGNCSETRDDEGLITRFKYDPLNRLKEKTLPDGAIVTYEYDEGSNLSSVTTPGDLAWHATYDLMGRKKSEEVRANGRKSRHWDYTYEDGLLRSAIDPKGNIHIYFYDLFNRLEKETVGKDQRSYAYDLRGLLIHAEQSCTDHTIVKRTYDPCCRLATETTILNGETIQESLQTWTPESKTHTINGSQRCFKYQGGRLKTLESEGLRFAYDYELSGLLKHVQTPFGSRKRHYRVDGLPEKCLHINNSGTIEENLKWDGTGKMRWYSCSAPHTSYQKVIEYDKRSRLKQMQDDVFTFDFDMPGCGTRTGAPGWEVPDDGLDPFGNVLKENIEGILTSNSYDRTGQLILRETNGKFERLSWDPWGRLIKVETKADTWEAAYDPFGRRLRTIYTPKGSAPIISTSLYDPSEEFLEIGVKTGSKTFWKVYGNGSLEAVVDDAGNAVGLIHDAIGNLIGVTSDRKEIWSNDIPTPYGPRGPPVLVFNTVLEFAQAQAWRDHRLDPTGYLWIGARHYDPISGRFLSPDPIGYPISLNLYTYANGDPINYFDPDGRMANAAYNSINATRIFGGLQALTGTAEMLAGGVVGVVCPPAGVIVVFHGADQTAAGISTMVTGVQYDTLTSTALQSAGFSRGSAEMIDTSLSIGFTMSGAALHSARAALLAPAYAGPAVSTGYAAAITSGREPKVLFKELYNSKSTYQANLLKTHLRQVEKYGVSGYRQLSNGKVRYYGEMDPAKVKGEMVGRRLVREWDPESGLKRSWHETLDNDGNIRFVRPETNDGNKIHYLFDGNGNFTGVR